MLTRTDRRRFPVLLAVIAALAMAMLFSPVQAQEGPAPDRPRGLDATATSAQTAAVEARANSAGICDRTERVRDNIIGLLNAQDLGSLGIEDCSEVTDEQSDQDQVPGPGRRRDWREDHLIEVRGFRGAVGAERTEPRRQQPERTARGRIRRALQPGIDSRCKGTT